MVRHFVHFLCPGTFFAETEDRVIDSWDVEKAKNLAKKITVRYNSKPYAFYFYTQEKKPDDWEAKVINQSHMYFINGKVYSLEEIKARNNSDDRILISNMEYNGWSHVVETYSPWKNISVFDDGDCIVAIPDFLS